MKPAIQASAEIARLKAAGYGPTAIARSLNARGISTPSGRGVWWTATVIRFGDPEAAKRWRRYIADYKRRNG